MILRIVLIAIALFVQAVLAQALDVLELEAPQGVTAWYVQDRSVPLVTMRFSFANGIISDPEGQEGAALFLSGLIDEGAGSLSGEAFRAAMEDIGMKIGFDADLDRFHGRYSVPSEFHAEGSELLRVALQELTFPTAAVERMRNYFAVSTESEKRQPGTLANRASLALALPGHRYDLAEQRGPAALPRLQRAELEAAQRRIFSRAGLKVVIVGDLSRDEAKTFLEKVFRPLPPGQGKAPAQQTTLVKGPKLSIVPFDAAQTLFQFGQQGLPPSDPDHLAATLASFMATSTLNDLARQQQGLTYGVTFELSQLDEASFTAGRLRTANENAREAYLVIKQALGLMLSPGPSETHLEATKTYLKGKYTLGFDSNEDVARTLLGLQIDGFSSSFLAKREELIDAVTIEDIRRATRKIIDPETLIVVAVGKPVGLEEIK